MTDAERWERRPSRDARARRAVPDAVGRADQAALHRGRPAGGIAGRDPIGFPASSRSRAASTRRCTAAGCGRCASSPASAPPRRPTSASTTCSSTARPASRTAFDMPSLMGHDSDHPRSLGEVGREGVAVDTLDDMETLFAGHRPRRGLRVDDDQRARRDHARLLRRRRRAPGRRAASSSRGTIQNDILKEYIAQKEWCFPIDPAMRLVCDMIEWCARAHAALAPDLDHRATTSARPARPPRRSSPSRSKDGLTYVEQAVDRGLDVDDFAPRLSFFFNAHIDFFEEIAKYRAARRIWARELRDTFGAKNRARWLMRFHTQTAGVSLTAQQPLNNIVRTAIEALAGVLGGTQSLHTNCYDEALALPTEDAVRIALRTQQIIAHETGVTNTIDPLGGSYFVEALTDQMERAGLRLLRAGSTSSAAWSRRSSAASRSARSPTRPSSYQREIDAGRRMIVGVNAYTEGDDEQTPILRSTRRSSASRSVACRRSARGATARAVEPRSPRSSRRPRPGGEPDAASARRRAGARHRRRDRRRPSRTCLAPTPRRRCSEACSTVDAQAIRRRSSPRRRRRPLSRPRGPRRSAQDRPGQGQQFFLPQTLTVKPGTTVKWVWKRGSVSPHDVTVTKGGRSSSASLKTIGQLSPRS